MSERGVQWRAVCDGHDGPEVPWENDRDEAEEAAEIFRDVLGKANVRVESRRYIAPLPLDPIVVAGGMCVSRNRAGGGTAWEPA